MRTKTALPHLGLLLLGAAAACSAPTPREAGAPTASSVVGWFLSGPRLQAFKIGVDREVRFRGAASGQLASVEKGEGAGTMMQSISAARYLGQRVRFSAMIRTRAVDGWSGIWLRIDRPDARTSFDNTQARPIKNDTEWTRVEVVLDVPLDALAIHFGLVQDGNGTSWIDDAALEVVSKDVAVTAVDPYPRALANADFEVVGDAGLAGEPSGWMVQGVAREDFVAARDTEEKHGGAASAKLMNKHDTPRGHAVLSQTIRADAYAGARVRVSAWVKARGLERGGRFSVHTFAADPGMFNPGLTYAGCPLHEGGEWRLCQGVLDVPSITDTIEVGLNLEGKGTAWVDDVKIEPVGLDVAITDVDDRPRALGNGDFEDGERGKPPHWFMAGGARAHYEANIDTSEKHGGRKSARLDPRVADPKGYGTLMQSFQVHDLRGKRMRMRAFVKGKDIDGRGDFWLRVQGVDSPGDGPGLGGGWERLQGTFDWKPVVVVFDVPERGDALDVGIGLAKHGTLWIDDVTLDEVDRTVPLTEDAERTTLEDPSFEAAVEKPQGWFLSGRAKKDLTVTIDTSEHAEGSKSVRIEPKAGKQTGYGTLMTSILAEPYRGKRMRMSARVKGRGVTGRGDMWLRVQGATSLADGPGLGGGSCTLAGDFDWKPCTVVFDVPERGQWIQMGVGLDAAGTLWLDDVKLEQVAKTSAITGIAVREKMAPENLDFEATSPTP
jgi:hypothetical protein